MFFTQISKKLLNKQRPELKKKNQSAETSTPALKIRVFRPEYMGKECPLKKIGIYVFHSFLRI